MNVALIQSLLLNTRLFTAVSIIALLLHFPLSGNTQTKQETIEQLENLHVIFDKKLKKDPKNVGAKKLNDNIEAILAIIDSNNGDLSKEKNKLNKLIQEGIKSASKFQTQDAKNLLAALEALAKHLEESEKKISKSGTSEATNTSANSSNIEVIAEEENLTPSSTSQEVSQNAENLNSSTSNSLINIAPSNNWKAKDNLIHFWLIFITSSLIGGLFFFYRHFSKRNRQIVNRIEELEEKMDKNNFSGSSSQTNLEISMQQQKQKLDALEANISSYMKKIDERLDKIENAQNKYNKAEEPEPALTTQNIAEKLSLRFTNSSHFSSDFSYHNLIETCYKIHNILLGLQERTQIPALYHAIEDILPSLRSITHLSPEIRLQLAKIAQLAYTSSLNEGNSEWYEQLKQALEELHFEIFDKMVGRMAFTEHYADNLSYDAFLTDFSIRNEEYPNFENAVHQIERSQAFQEEINNIILYTLKPAICYSDDTGKTVLRKGKYVINI